VSSRYASGREENGQVLLMALVFLTAIAIIMAALLGFAFTSFAAAPALRSATQSQYSADAAVEQAIANLRTPANDNAFQPFTPAQFYNQTSGGCPGVGTASNGMVTIGSVTYRDDCEALPPGGLGQVEVVIVACPDPTPASPPPVGCANTVALRATVWFTQQLAAGQPSIATIVSWSDQQGSGS